MDLQLSDKEYNNVNN